MPWSFFHPYVPVFVAHVVVFTNVSNPAVAVAKVYFSQDGPKMKGVLPF